MADLVGEKLRSEIAAAIQEQTESGWQVADGVKYLTTPQAHRRAQKFGYPYGVSAFRKALRAGTLDPAEWGLKPVPHPGRHSRLARFEVID